MNPRIILILIGLLSSCATTQQDTKDTARPAIPTIAPVIIPPPVIAPVPVVINPAIIKTPTTPNIGKPIASVISVVGEPSGVVDPKPGIRYFQFSVHSNKTNCVASYLTTRDNDKAAWIIKEYIAPDSKIC